MKKLISYLLALFLIVLSCSEDNEPQIVLKYNLTTEVTPVGGGTISPSSGSFDEGEKVSLTAVPATGYIFKNWTGALSGSNLTTSITMSNHKQVGAVFEVDPNLTQTKYKDISVIELEDNSDFDFLVVLKESSDYLMVKTSDSDPESPENVLFYNSTTEEYLSLFYNDIGQIKKMVSGDHIILLDNFNGNHLDAAVIDSNGEMEITRNIETNFNWEANTWQKNYGTKSSEISSWLNTISLNIDAANCTVAFLTLDPLGAFNCGLNIGERIGIYLRENDIFEIEVSQEFIDNIDSFFDFYDGFSLAIGCATGSFECFTESIGFINLQVIKPINEWLDEEEDVINEIKACLEDESKCSISQTFLEKYDQTTWITTTDDGENLFKFYFDTNNPMDIWFQEETGSSCYVFYNTKDGIGENFEITKNSDNELIIQSSSGNYTDILEFTMEGETLNLIYKLIESGEEEIIWNYNFEKTSRNVDEIVLCVF